MHKRALILFATLMFAFSGLIARLYSLTQGVYADVAETQSSYTVTLATARGTLYDRSLNRLTNTGGGYAAAVLGTPAALAAFSDYYTEQEFESLCARLAGGKPAVVTANEPLPLAQGISQYTVPHRYADSELAVHIIGTLDETGQGAGGAERALNELLVKYSGALKVTYQTDGTGQVLSDSAATVENTLDKANGGAALTIDYNLQNAVQVLAGEKISRGAAVIMEIATGDVLAMASFPAYSPARIADYLEREDAPLFNRATAAYNCGSVFKTVTAMAALESGTAPTQSFLCNGYVQVGENRIKCHHVLGHGQLTMAQGFAQSCNPYFIGLSQQTGGSPLYRFASLLRFDSPILLMNNWQTDRATLPAESTLSGTLLANVSIGQGDLLATPLHVAAMTACVAAGGEYRRPNLYYGEVNEQGVLTPTEREPAQRVCSLKTAETLAGMMRAVVSEGTGKEAAPTVGTAAGKTGTAQTGWKSENGDTMVHSWFTGFYPAEQPQYAITVLAEDSGTTGEDTASVFALLCDTLYRQGFVKIPS